MTFKLFYKQIRLDIGHKSVAYIYLFRCILMVKSKLAVICVAEAVCSPIIIETEPVRTFGRKGISRYVKIAQFVAVKMPFTYI